MTEQLAQESWVKLAEGDAEVWREFIGREIEQLYRMFMRRWANPSLAEELVQKTVFDAVAGRGSYDSLKGSPEKWIFGIAKNNLAYEMRKRASRRCVSSDVSGYLEAMDGELLPDEIVEREETAEIVREVLGRLESKEEACLRFKYIEGMSARQISKEIGISEKAVHSLLYRARISFRRELEKRFCGGEEE